MKTEYLRYFIEIGRSSSLSEAARRLFISQQGLNKAATAMEAELGVQLMERTRGGVRLTPEGERFLSFAKDIVATYDEALESIGAKAKVVSFDDVAVLATPYGMAALTRSFPIESASLRENSFDAVVARLLEPESDLLALIDVFSDSDVNAECEQRGLSREKYRVEPLFSTRLGILVHRDHPLAAQFEVSPEEIVDVPIALIQDETVQAVTKRIFGEAGFTNVVLETGNASLFSDQIRRGRSVGLLDSYCYWSMVAGKLINERIAFVPLKTSLVDTTCFVYKAGAPLEAKHQMFVERAKVLFASASAGYVQP